MRLTVEQEILVNQIVAENRKDRSTLFALWLLFATLGMHRFYLGNRVYAFVLILFGWMTFFIWPYLDLIFAVKELERQNARLRENAINHVLILHGGVQGNVPRET